MELNSFHLRQIPNLPPIFAQLIPKCEPSGGRIIAPLGTARDVIDISDELKLKKNYIVIAQREIESFGKELHEIESRSEEWPSDETKAKRLRELIDARHAKIPRLEGRIRAIEALMEAGE